MNNGDGTFTDVTDQYGVGGFEFADGATSNADLFYSSCNALIFFDYDNDGWPDLMVTNQRGSLGSRDMLYRNKGVIGSVWQGFELMTWRTDFDALQVYGGGATMGIDVGDFDNDGDFDWSETDVLGDNDLFLNRESNSGGSSSNNRVDHCTVFDTGERSKPTSWGTKWEDLNNDGLIDQFYVTQITYFAFRNYLYMNAYDSAIQQQQFIESAQALGVGNAVNNRGLMTADYNQDGLVDLFTVVWGNSNSSSSWLYENQWPNAGKWLSIKLIGDPTTPGPDGFSTSTKDAIGARVTAWAILDGNPNNTSPVTKQIREVRSGDSNGASTSSLELEFGFGQATEAALRVEFPSGQAFNYWIQFTPIGQGKRLVIDESTATPRDINCDGVADNADLNMILNNLGCEQSGPHFCKGDINTDGVVDDLDVQIWLAQ